jgi:hypothetical protein
MPVCMHIKDTDECLCSTQVPDVSYIICAFSNAHEQQSHITHTHTHTHTQFEILKVLSEW